MNFDDYEKKYFSIYDAFAETVRFIFERVLLAVENLPRPQSIQCRAKGIECLRRRLRLVQLLRMICVLPTTLAVDTSAGVRTLLHSDR